MLEARLQALGYRSLEEIRAESEASEIYDHFDFEGLEVAGARLLAFPSVGQRGVWLDLLVFGEASELSRESISAASERFWESHRESLAEQLRIRERSKPEQLLERISLRFLVFSEDEEDSRGLASLRAKEKVRVQAGKRSFFRPGNRTFHAFLDWSVSIVSLATAQIFERRRRPFDAVGSEARLAARQALPWKPPQAAREWLPLRLLRVVFQELLDYFQTLFQFVTHRHLFAHLVVHRHYIGAEKVLVYYLVGIGLSVMLPMILTLGAITPQDLLTFGDLPPIVDEVVELLVSTGWIALEALSLHFGLRILRCRGSLKSLFLSLFFVYAFFQLFDRSFEYFLSGPLMSMFDDLGEYYRVAGRLGSLRWPLFAYFAFPFIYIIYRASLRTAATAYIAVALAFISATALLTGGQVFDLSLPRLAKLDGILDEEQRILAEFQSTVTPLLQEGDQTGDYSAALRAIEPIRQDIEALEAKTELVASRMAGEDTHPQALLLRRYIGARGDLLGKLASWIAGDIPEEEFDEASARHDELTEAYNRGLVNQQWPSVYLLYLEELDILTKFDEEVMPLLGQGDESGDYDPAMAALGPMPPGLDDLAARAAGLGSELEDPEMKAVAALLEQRLIARRDVMSALAAWIGDEITKEVFDEHMETVQTAASMYEKAAASLSRAPLYLLAYDEWRLARRAPPELTLPDLAERFGRLSTRLEELSTESDAEAGEVIAALGRYLDARLELLSCRGSQTGRGESGSPLTTEGCRSLEESLRELEEAYRSRLATLE